MSMQYSGNGYKLTMLSEGAVLKSYQDGRGVWTIGYGHTLGVAASQSCTQQQALDWLHLDIQSAVGAVNALVKAPLNQNQFDALVDFTFNLGSGNLSRSSLLIFVNKGQWLNAYHEFAKWNLCAGKPEAGLTTRREAEATLFATPITQGA